MKQKNKVIFTLLILSPIIAELLSGSSPPLEFFNPISFIFWGLLYGCGTLLIREAKVKWNMQWSVIFLATAYGIIEEGLTTKALFNPNWADVGVYANYGTFFGILIPWSLVLLTFHATLSTLIPILIVDLTWPEYKKTNLIEKRGLILTFIGLISIVLLGMRFMGTMVDGEMIPYYPNPLLLFGSFILVIFLIYLGYKFRSKRIISEQKIFSPILFAIVGFLFMLAFTIIPHQLAQVKIPLSILIGYQILVILGGLIFSYYHLLNKNITVMHLVSLIFGSIMYWIIFAVFLELNGILGMSVVGITSLIILIIWRKRMLYRTIQINNR
jgi:hypothetical protein